MTLPAVEDAYVEPEAYETVVALETVFQPAKVCPARDNVAPEDTVTEPGGEKTCVVTDPDPPFATYVTANDVFATHCAYR